MHDSIYGKALLALAAFIPAIIYVVWIRNTERYQREPWGAIFAAFIWGATIAVGISIVLELLFGPLGRGFPLGASLWAAVVLAPFVEEFAKPLGVTYVRKAIREPEDGLVYGAICGLGFAATENLIYIWSAASAGSVASLVFTILVRSVASMLLHASATAITGYGISLMILGKKEPLSVLPFYLAAVLIHGAFNFIVSVPIFGLFGSLASLALAIAFSLGTIRYVRTKIMKLDAREFWQEVVWWK